ncbi:LysR family transcriptional regulator [Pseudomonas sp. NFACC04-2]|uniref:LysR family transcriptional regulator n=1 Tax=Pseudomonas sp. NFACC04-2 TaxID=1566242 RepID=UPI002114E654|nr:LysR family transcriptional regulator [Pseudomonas sp. NFACC04-2]
MAVLRTGSLSAAARVLGIAQATARRRIDALERSVGTSLFVRSPAGLMPTDNARELTGHAQSMALAAEAFARAASAQVNVSGGIVRVTSNQLLAVEVLPSMLCEIRAAQPQLALELSVSNRLEDLALQEADVAVRIRRPVEASIITRRVGDLRVGLYATAGLLEHRGRPRCADELNEYPVIGPDRNLTEQAFLAQQGFLCSGEQVVFRSDDHLAQFAALRAGLGIGVCSSQLARRHDLVRVLL